MTGPAVVIAGAGPTGMMLAAELALAGTEVAVVERRESPELAGSRAGGLHARSIEVLDQRGVAGRFVAQGTTYPVVHFAGITLDISDFPSRHPYVLGLWQNHIERILNDWISELGVPVHRGRTVTGFAADDGGVDVELSAGRPLRARYLVGCDGGRSRVRRAAGIAFPGWDPTTSSLIAEAETAGEPELGVRRDDKGTHGIVRLEDGRRVRVVVRDERLESGEPTLGDLSRAMTAVWGTDFGVHSPTSISRFTDVTRQAAAYRKGRVLLAGDAAHVHWPVGGQGLGIGLQDAVNLGWKLAQVDRGASPDSLLDSYQAERHPVAARVLRTTLAGTALSRSDARSDALRDIMSGLLQQDQSRRRYAGELSGLDIRYDLGDGHPLLGRRMPDLDLAVAASGPRRVYSLLHAARPVLLNLGPPGALDGIPGRDRVRLVDAAYGGRWELPLLGPVPAPGAVLIRPDGYVAWTGDPSADRGGLGAALAAWFGVASDPA